MAFRMAFLPYFSRIASTASCIRRSRARADCSSPSRERRFVGKQIELNVFRLGLHVPLPLHMVRDDIHPAHEQPAVHDPVKQHRQRLQELSGGGGRRPERF